MSAAPWFKFFPGDYLADTQRLTQSQHGAYMLLMLDYYSSGEPPPDDDQVLASITRSASLSDWLAIRKAIAKYFAIHDGLWHHDRCEKEIEARSVEHKGKSSAGKKGNKIRWGTSQSESQASSHNASQSESLIDRNTRYQIPDTRGQKLEPKESKTTTVAKAAPPPCPHQEIIALYAKRLPAGRQPDPALWNGTRAQHLQARWREKPERQNLEWWDRWFSFIAQSDFLTGKVAPTAGRKQFELSLDWILKNENWVKIHEGAYK